MEATEASENGLCAGCLEKRQRIEGRSATVDELARIGAHVCVGCRRMISCAEFFGSDHACANCAARFDEREDERKRRVALGLQTWQPAG